MRAWTSLVVALGTAPLAAQANKINPDLVTVDVRPAEGAAYDRLIYLTNRNVETVIVTSLQVVDCVNVSGGCGGARSAQLWVMPRQQVMLLRVQAGAANHPPTFKLSYTWKPERIELGPPVVVLHDHSSKVDSTSGKKVITRDSVEAAAVDSIVVVPAAITVHVGKQVYLGKVLTVSGRDAHGNPASDVTFHMTVDTGRTFARLSGGMLTGLKPGSAILLVSPPQPASVHPRGASRVVVTVVP